MRLKESIPLFRSDIHVFSGGDRLLQPAGRGDPRVACGGHRFN